MQVKQPRHLFIPSDRKIFGIEKYVMRLSLHDPEKLGQKYVNEPELWLETEDMVRQVLIEANIPFVEVKGEEDAV